MRIKKTSRTKTGIAVSLALLSLVFVLTGCSIRLRFYPVQGPVAAATPNQIFLGTITAASTFNPRSGGFSATLANGETFHGSWSMVRASGKDNNLPPALAGTQDIRGAWDAVYEKGFFVAHVLGQPEYGRSVSTGSKGTKLQVEIFSPGTTGGETRAVAQDSNGNIYKVSPY
jgi:hypothetical protein